MWNQYYIILICHKLGSVGPVQQKNKLPSPYFVMGASINVDVVVFWETSVSFLKSVALQLFPKYSYVKVIARAFAATI